MIEVIGMHRLDDGQIVCHLGEVGEAVRKLRTGLPVLGKRKTWAEDCSIRLNKSIALALDHGWRDWFPLNFLQLWFIIKQFKLTGSSCHKQINDPLGFYRKTHEVRLTGSSKGFVGKQRGEGDLANPNSTVLEKMAAGAMK